MMSFHGWCVNVLKSKKGTVVLDLCSDIVEDSGFPKLLNSVIQIHEYLSNSGACDDAHHALDQAWAEYRSIKNDHWYRQYLDIKYGDDDEEYKFIKSGVQCELNQWNLEYSEKARRAGTYPFHIEPAGRRHPDNEWSNSWKVIFTGTSSQVHEKLHEAHELFCKETGFNNEPVDRDQSESERRKMSPKIRYEILRRDGFKCVLCGRQTIDGVKLQVDHILPVSKGGLTELNNLRTLCFECNIGKGSQIE